MEDRIDFMNLKQQVQCHKKEYMEVIEAVCGETAFSGGKYAEAFERQFAEYIGTRYCAGVDSGTGALFLAVKALGIQSGDEVIVPANTFIASAWGVVHNGATPVFVDCEADTWEIKASDIESHITSRTKAIIGVHLYGQPFDFDEVEKIARQYDLYLIEDCAQAHGALYKGRKAGQLGDVACFSFYPGKNLGAFGEGGAVTTNDKSVYESICRLKNHGCVQRYHHDEIGYNMRLDGIQGAILSCKLQYLDEWNARRKQIAGRYLSEIKNIKIIFQAVPDFADSVYHLCEVMVENRDLFMEHMEKNNIYCGQHYPVPCHLQKAFSYLNYKQGDYANAERLARSCVSLPMYPELTEEEVTRVINACNDY